MDVRREHPGLAVSFLAYYVVLVAYGVATGSAQVVFYALFVALGAVIVGWLYVSVRLSALVLWGLAAWGLAHMIGGLVAIDGRVIYEWSLGGGQMRLDKVVHFFGFGFSALAGYELVRASVGEQASSRAIAIIAFFLGLGVGAVNETVEFLITLLPAESNVGGFSNTGWDLVANTAGAAVAAILAPRLERARRGEAAFSGSPSHSSSRIG